MSNKKKSESGGSSLAGWAQAIQADGQRMAKQEMDRRSQAKKIREDAKRMPPLDRIRTLLTANELGDLRLTELFEDLRDAVGLPPLE